MAAYRLTAQELNLWLQRIIDSGQRVIAPVNEPNGIANFKELGNADEIADDGVVQTAQSPKSAAFPQAETIFEYTKASNGEDAELSAPPADTYPHTVVWRMRPCDVAGFAPLSAIMNWDYKDTMYNARNERVTLVAFACVQSDEYCFCTSVGGAPDRAEGSDVFITTLASNDVIVETLTKKGEDLWAMAGFHKDVVSENISEKIVANVQKEFSLEEIRQHVSATPFDNPIWKQQSMRCLGCGACAYVCPTCACFDIQEDAHGSKGRRLRCWDSCGFGLFTKHTSGHNPRPTQATRWRQRLLHKFSYMPDRLQVVGCTGCGRCSRACPVDMNIKQHLKHFAR